MEARESRPCGTQLLPSEVGISDEKDLTHFPAHFHVDKSECSVYLCGEVNSSIATDFPSWSSQDSFWACSEVHNCILLKTELPSPPEFGLQELSVSEPLD